MILWHYTTGRSLGAILRDRELRPFGDPRGERPAVWFTEREQWDPGASIGIYRTPSLLEAQARGDAIRRSRGEEAARSFLLGVAQTMVRDVFGGLMARIGVDPQAAPHTWDDWKRITCMSPEAARQIEEQDRAKGAGNRQWRISLEPVPASRWVALEVRRGLSRSESWEPVDRDLWAP